MSLENGGTIEEDESQVKIEPKVIDIPAAYTYSASAMSGRGAGKDFAAMSYRDVFKGYEGVGFSLLNQDALSVEYNHENEAVAFAVGDGVSGANFFSGVFTKMVVRSLSKVMATSSGLSDEQIEQKFEQLLRAELEEWGNGKEEVVKRHILEVLKTVPRDGYARYLREAVKSTSAWSTMAVSGRIDRAKGTIRFATFGDVTLVILDKDSGNVIFVRGNVENQMVFDPVSMELSLPQIYFQTLKLPKNYRIMAFTDGMAKGKMQNKLEGLLKNNKPPKETMDEIKAILDANVLDDDVTAFIADGEI
ncbi:MAG: protein phosphatase 2C domain-containing protein [Candidatus Gracilibacteria bacterium]|jgi:serine/threonine protein phosphatase PrpC